MANGGFSLVKRLQCGVVLSGIILAVGCNNPPPSDQQIQQKTAETTQQVKAGAQQAASQARTAAATAVDKVNAVAAGVKQGLQNGAPATVNLNTATSQQLETLPGITPAKAHKIIAGRPYSIPNDLVTKNVLTQDQFDLVSGKVAAP